MTEIKPVKITERALAEIKQILATKNIPDGYGLRVGVRAAGCGVADQYVGFDIANEGDISYNLHGVEVLIEKKQVMFLMGQEIDFYEGADERGFVFSAID